MLIEVRGSAQGLQRRAVRRWVLCERRLGEVGPRAETTKMFTKMLLRNWVRSLFFRHEGMLPGPVRTAASPSRIDRSRPSHGGPAPSASCA